MHRTTLAGVGLLACLLPGCTNIGASTVSRDRFDYSAAIADSWKRQTILNIVKLRYMDPPVFVDVGQIVAGYTVETSLNGTGGVTSDPPGVAGGSSAAIGGSVRYTDRPTITYVPMTGNRFVRALMTPLPPEAVFSAIAAGWPADRVLSAALTTINGLDNMRTSIAGPTPPDPKFLRAMELLTAIQDSGAVSLRVRKQGETGPASVVVIRNDPAPEVQAKSIELRSLLGLSPDAREFHLAFGANQQGPEELAVVTRSLLHVMQIMAAGVEVPEVDVAEGRALPGLRPDDQIGRLLRMHCSDAPPADAFAAVSYRGRSFWIDDRDLASKRALAFLMMLFTLAEPGSADNAPVLTIPT